MHNFSENDILFCIGFVILLASYIIIGGRLTRNVRCQYGLEILPMAFLGLVISTAIASVVVYFLWHIKFLHLIGLT